MMAGRVHRVTMFKLPNVADQKQLIEQFRILGETQLKDGKPYILSIVAGQAEDDPRAQDYTVVGKTEFASVEDMQFYDNDCVAHARLKTLVQSLDIRGVASVYFHAQVMSP